MIFDLDNTLIDRQRIFREMLKRRLREYHTNMTDKEFECLVDEIILWDNHGNQDRLSIFEKYVNKYQVNATAEEINTYWDLHSGEFVYVFEDALDTLLYLKDKYRLAILSNGNVISQRRKLNSLPFLDMFEYTLVSGEIGIHKPEKAIFMKVCDDMQVLPEECVFIGDNYRCDIEGAHNAGMKPIWITIDDKKTDICRKISKLSDLKQLY